MNPSLPVAQDQAGADWVMRLLDTGEWRLTRFRNDPSMTEDYCRRNSWQVERQCAPYCGDNDVTFWRAETAEQAFIAAINDLFPGRLAEFGKAAPSLPAAGLADLTAVRCQCCATEYPHDSYDAGFIAGSGMCQVCDAAMPPKDLPAAGSAVEDVSSFRLPDSSDCYGFGYVDGTCIQSLRGARNHLEELLDAIPGESFMTVAQHERIVAALSAQQPAPERVSVPMELLQSIYGATPGAWWAKELRTILDGAT